MNKRGMLAYLQSVKVTVCKLWEDSLHLLHDYISSRAVASFS